MFLGLSIFNDVLLNAFYSSSDLFVLLGDGVVHVNAPAKLILKSQRWTTISEREGDEYCVT